MKIKKYGKYFVYGFFIATKTLTESASALADEAKAPLPCNTQPQVSQPPSNGEESQQTTEDGAQKKSIEKIAINIAPVFDENNPEENNWIFRGVNYLHINTHPRVIKNDLLFKEGDVLDEKILAESERKLRTRPYLNNPTIESTSCEQPTTVNVNVREVWTLLPEISLSHSGGRSSSSFGLHDSNFLGLGKTVNVSHTNTPARTGQLFEYYDPNTGIEDSILSLDYADNSDGIAKTLQFIKPFAALNTDWTAGITYEKYSEEDTLYNAGEEADRFAHDNSSHSFFYGIKLNTGVSDSVHRFLVGYSTTNDIFSSVTTPNTVSTFVPDDRQYSYPWIEYEHVYDGYIQTYNIQQINRVEDVNLGSQIRFRIGYTSSKYTSFDRDAYFDAEYSQAFLLSENQLLVVDATSKGLYGDSETYGKSVFFNTVTKGTAAYHWQDFKRGQFYVGLTTSRGLKQFGDLPLELGGDTGLRGYPARYQAGDHLHLLTVEQRFFGEKEWFSLFHIGAAIFYDEGRVWGEGAIPQEQEGRLRDVGIGLRISGTRTGNRVEGSHNILHIDIASPLDGSNDISKVQWIVRVKQSF